MSKKKWYRVDVSTVNLKTKTTEWREVGIAHGVQVASTIRKQYRPFLTRRVEIAPPDWSEADVFGWIVIRVKTPRETLLYRVRRGTQSGANQDIRCIENEIRKVRAFQEKDIEATVEWWPDGQDDAAARKMRRWPYSFCRWSNAVC